MLHTCDNENLRRVCSAVSEMFCKREVVCDPTLVGELVTKDSDNETGEGRWRGECARCFNEALLHKVKCFNSNVLFGDRSFAAART